MGFCHYCRTAVSADVLRRHRLCPQCGSDLHCCRNCEHFDPASATPCREPDSPWVANRETENQCGYFEFRRGAPTEAPSRSPEEANQAEIAKRAFAALFRNRLPPSS